jgi:hypothetical protein
MEDSTIGRCREKLLQMQSFSPELRCYVKLRSIRADADEISFYTAFIVDTRRQQAKVADVEKFAIRRGIYCAKKLRTVLFPKSGLGLLLLK